MHKALWIGDNGRITCKDHAGVTAQCSGMRRDLSGGRMDRLTVADAREFATLTGVEPSCETCHATLALVLA